jgi:predicted nucleic acid-binding protein
MPVADTLLRLAESPALYDARWSNQILAEVTRTLIGKFGKSPEKASYREAAMREFFSDSLVQDYESLVAEMQNHPKDRHVLAAAVTCRADYLITFNLKDFPPQSAEKYKIEVIGPSTFLKNLLALDRDVVEERLRDQAAALGLSLSELLDRLAASVPVLLPLFECPDGRMGRCVGLILSCDSPRIGVRVRKSMVPCTA